MFSATSSIEQILIVDRVKGTPNSSLACAASISPSRCCMPHKPVGAKATGIDTFCPINFFDKNLSSMSTPTLCLNLILPKSF